MSINNAIGDMESYRENITNLSVMKDIELKCLEKILLSNENILKNLLCLEDNENIIYKRTLLCATVN